VGQAANYLVAWHEEFRRETVRLLLDDMTPRLCVQVHDQMTEFVCGVISLPVMVLLERIEQNDWPYLCVDRVSVDRCGLQRAEYSENAAMLHETYKVGYASRLQREMFACLSGGFLWTGAQRVIDTDGITYYVAAGKFDVILKRHRNVCSEESVGVSLVASDLGS